MFKLTQTEVPENLRDFFCLLYVEKPKNNRNQTDLLCVYTTVGIHTPEELSMEEEKEKSNYTPLAPSADLV